MQWLRVLLAENNPASRQINMRWTNLLLLEICKAFLLARFLSFCVWRRVRSVVSFSHPAEYSSKARRTHFGLAASTRPTKACSPRATLAARDTHHWWALLSVASTTGDIAIASMHCLTPCWSLALGQNLFIPQRTPRLKTNVRRHFSLSLF